MKNLALFLAAFAFSAAVHAAPPSDAAIESLLATMKVERLVKNLPATMEPAMRQMMANFLKGKTVTAEQRRALDNMTEKMLVLLREETDWKVMRPMYVQLYKEVFTQEEVDGMIAFYKTPAGAATIEKMPLVMQRSMVMMQERMAPMMQKMEAAMRQAIAESKGAK